MPRRADEYAMIIRNTLKNECKVCGTLQGVLYIHHKRYGPDVTIDDMDLLCHEHHKEAHAKMRAEECLNIKL